MGMDDEIDLVVGIGPVVGIGLIGGTGLIVSLTYVQKSYALDELINSLLLIIGSYNVCDR